MNVEELETQIAYYSSKYYEGDPQITDEQFDSLVDKLRAVKPNSEVLKTGWGFEVVGDKVKHKYSHIGSLDKTKSYSEIPERFKNRMVYISPKLDGLSAVAYYKNGVLVKGVTRGNGEYGKDITDKLTRILGKTISDTKFTGAIRGELIISNDNWDLLKQKYVNIIAPRNFVAGIINRNDIDDDIVYVDLVVYKIVGQENNPIMKTRDDILKWLSLNFKKVVPDYYYPILNEPSWLAFHNDTYEQFKKLGYGLDGLVLTSPDVLYNSATLGYMYDEVAFKFKAESAETTIQRIEWTLTRTQRLVPVAVVEPVELSGANISRATCNNAQMVKNMQLGEGAKIEIMRANEVIPFIVDVIEGSNEPLPEVCPYCGANLVWDGVDLKCDNANCPNIKLSDLQQWCECVGETDGLQWTLMKQYLDTYGVTTIHKLYENGEFILMDLASKKLSLTEVKIQEFFEKLLIKPIEVEKALLGLNVPRLGEKTAKLLAKNKDIIFNLINISLGNIDDNMYNWTKQKLMDTVKEATTTSIIANINKFRTLRYTYVDDFYNNSRLVFSNIMGSNKLIAVTGSLETMKRADFERFVNKYGYELSSNLKKCKYLVTNNPSSGSTKNKQAQEYGVEIITEKDFLNLLDN